MNADDLRRIIARHTRSRQLGLFGEPRVNVLELNLDLDASAPAKPPLEIRLCCDQKTSGRALTQRTVREANFPAEAFGG
jgi:hypothetical protein